MNRKIRPGLPVRGSTTGRPLMAALDLLGQRWTLRVVWELRAEPVGFRELAGRCDDVSTAVLRDRLLELLDAGVVQQDDDRRYLLTTLGRDLVAALVPLDGWAKRWARTLR